MKELSNITFYLFFSSLFLIFILTFVYFFFIQDKKKTFSTFSNTFQIKIILNIALLSAFITAFLVVFYQFTPLLVFPWLRVAFEGLFVKIAGFVFGPIIGIASALITELAVLIFVSSYFHYKYLLVLISVGAFSGLVKVFLTAKVKPKQLLFLLLFAILFFFVLTMLFFGISFYNQNSELYNSAFAWDDFFINFQKQYLTSFSFQTISFYSILLLFLIMLVVWVCAVYCINWKSKNFLTKLISKKSLLNILPIAVLAIFSEYFVSVFISTSANQSLFGETAKDGFILFVVAITIAPFKMIINIFIIYRVWTLFHLYLNKKS